MDKHNAKFSRRLFNQYFISAIIPVMILALLSFYTVSNLLKKNAERQIYSESRAVGLTIYDRFLAIESNLLNISASIIKNEYIRVDERDKNMFSSLYVEDKNKDKKIFIGNPVIDYSLSQEHYDHLYQNKRLLFFTETAGNDTHLLMLHVIDTDQHKLLVAELNPDYLWDITTKEDDVFCIVIDTDKLLFCHDYLYQVEYSSSLKDYLASPVKTSLQEVSLQDEVYLGNEWELFLEANYALKALSVIYFMPKKNAFLEYEYYKDMLPLSISITLLLVFILSSVQMRRSLLPLNSLTRAAKNIIAGDFTKKVEINSNDEFEVLGNTFNDMTHQLDEKIKKIKTLAKIDRLILSSLDIENIVEVLIEYVPTIMPADNVAVLVMSQEPKNEGTLFYNKGSFNNLAKSDLILSDVELEELINAEHIISKTDVNSTCYIDPLVNSGDLSFIIYPVKINNELLGGICIGFPVKINNECDYNESMVEVSDRVAVAFSNANWEKKLFHQAHYDALTALPNRYLFQDRLEQAIERAKRNNLSVAMLFIDLDRFKSINDSLGHAVGDKLLVEVSDLLLKCVRSYDSVARFGGDEFTIIVSDLKDDEIIIQTEKLSCRILELMSKPIVIDDREFHVTPSIGIAVYPRDADNLSDLLKNADTAMYEAKKLSSGNYQYYQKKQNKETLARLELENDLRRAMEEQQLELYYQPKINLRNCKIYDVEALIRWNHPERGLLSPGVFIPLAEEIGLISDIGYWVMRTACKQNKAWDEENIKLNIAVNVSADQFRQPAMYEKVVEILEETKVNPSLIELEITESLTIENLPKTIKLLNQFREHGLGICMDDFGTGYSSMTYLQKIPINKLKIDKSFIDNIHLHDDTASITKAIVALAHSLSLTVVAEGVETKAQYDYLNAISCDEAQGFFLCKPLPESELIQHILLYNDCSSETN